MSERLAAALEGAIRALEDPDLHCRLRCFGLTAPFVVDRPMNRRIFETYIETQIAPTLSKGDVGILDNLAAHKSPKAEAAIKTRGAWILFLPPYSPISIRSKWPSPS